MGRLTGKVELYHTYDGKLLDTSSGRLLTEELAGEFVSETGERASYLAAVQICALPEESTWVQAFEVYTFEDSSSLMTSVKFSVDGDLQNPYQADIDVLNGSGKYAGTKGQGKLVGTSDGQNAQHQIEIDLF